VTDAWDPEQYRRFAAERVRPFEDLLALTKCAPGGRAIDLGCGSGELTVRLHEHLGARETVGLDTSAAMLANAPSVAGVRFVQADLSTFEDAQGFDVVFSNAALQWVPDHERLLPRLWRLVRGGGQFVVQMPANFDHPSHGVARDVGLAHGVPPPPMPDAVLPPRRYAQTLCDLGAEDVHVRLQVYPMRLASTAEVVEWVKGTLLTHHRGTLSAPAYEAFLVAYRAALLERLGDPAGTRPYLYTYDRILLRAVRPA
jgi:trans-aconitate 2-methyltransferase